MCCLRLGMEEPGVQGHQSACQGSRPAALNGAQKTAEAALAAGGGRSRRRSRAPDERVQKQLAIIEAGSDGEEEYFWSSRQVPVVKRMRSWTLKRRLAQSSRRQQQRVPTANTEHLTARSEPAALARGLLFSELRAEALKERAEEAERREQEAIRKQELEVELRSGLEEMLAAAEEKFERERTERQMPRGSWPTTALGAWA